MLIQLPNKEHPYVLRELIICMGDAKKFVARDMNVDPSTIILKDKDGYIFQDNDHISKSLKGIGSIIYVEQL